MKLLPGERILLESDPKGLVLTTYRIRSETPRRGHQEVISIMLEGLASCTITHHSSPGLLVCAAISIVLGLMEAIGSTRNQYAITTGVIIALIFVVIYSATRQQIIVLASGGASIKSSTKGMDVQTAKDFIDIVETAKNERYLQAKAEHRQYGMQT